MAAAKPDPLVAALIAKLPASGTAWPVESRRAWLQMAAMAFDVVYGGPPGGSMADGVVDMPAFLEPQPTAAAASKPEAPTAPPAKPERVLPLFVIDPLGNAKRTDTGDQVMPADVGGIIYDMRGEHGDLSAIVWADGSRGVRGLQLEISTSV